MSRIFSHNTLAVIYCADVSDSLPPSDSWPTSFFTLHLLPSYTWCFVLNNATMTMVTVLDLCPELILYSLLDDHWSKFHWQFPERNCTKFCCALTFEHLVGYRLLCILQLICSCTVSSADSRFNLKLKRPKWRPKKSCKLGENRSDIHAVAINMSWICRELTWPQLWGKN